MIKFIGNPEIQENPMYELSNIEECKKWLKSIPYVELDTETEGFFNHKNKIVMLQLNHENDSFVIDVRYTSILPLKDELESLLCYGQNIKFDYKFLKFHGIELTKVIDTFLIECILTNGLKDRKLGLKDLALKYLGVVLDKSVRNQFIGLRGQPFTNKQIVYGIDDVKSLKKIADKQLKKINELNLDKVVDLENEVTLVLADIEYNGLGFNKDQWLKIANSNKNRIPSLEKELDTLVLASPKLKKFVNKFVQGNLFGYEERQVNITWSSPTQLLPVFRALGLEIDSTSEKDIAKYQDKYPLIKSFIDYKKSSKLVTTYGESFLDNINPKTNRIHTNFWQILETHRISSNDPNLQNLPATNEFLNCFISREGFSIIGCDFSGQEARIAAYGSGDEMWLNTFLEGKDLHSEVCKMMFNITDELVKTKPDFLRGKSYRDVAKTINFGCLFGMSEFKLSKTLLCSVEEAKDYLTKYFAATKQLKSYLDACSRYGLKNGFIRSYKPFSGIRYFPNWRPNLDPYVDSKVIGEITRASYNTPVQMSGALMTKLALTKINKYIKEHKLTKDIFIVHTVHDAIYTECRDELCEEFSKVQASLMSDAGKEFTSVLEFKTDITINKFWQK